MKTAISLPDDLFFEAEKVQKRKHVSRSEFYAMAIRWFVQHEAKNGITEQLNKVYAADAADAADAPGVDDRAMSVQRDAIGGRGEW
jgi:metal-responsive CopG/Arc/MetJ family transcriptional regulator